MARWLRPLLVVATPLIVILGACGGPGESASSGGPSGADAGSCQVNVLGPVPDDGQQAPLEAAFTEFESEFNCAVVARWQGTWDEMAQNIQTARLANEPVDIVLTGATLDQTLARTGVLMDITDIVEPFADRFVPGTLEAYTMGDRVWGVPLSDSSTSAVFYNKTLFDELGIDPPQTYAELVEVADEIRTEMGILPLIQQGKDIAYWPMWFFETFAQTSDQRSLDLTTEFLSGNRQFNSPEEVDALKALQTFYEDGIVTQESLDTDGDGMNATFLQGKAAMLYNGTWQLPTIRGAEPAFELGVFEFPKLPDAPGSPQHGGGPDNGWSIAASIPPERISMAAQLLEFVTRPRVAGSILAPLEPVNPSIQGVPAGSDPLAPQISTEFGPDTITYLDWIWPTEVTEAVAQAVPAVMTGARSAEEAAADVQQAYDDLVAQSDYRYDWWATWSDADWAKVRPASVPTVTIGE